MLCFASLTTTSHRGSDRPHKEKPAAGMRNVSMFAPKPAPVPIVGPRITELPDDYEEETEPIPRIPFGRNRGLSSLSSMRMQVRFRTCQMDWKDRPRVLVGRRCGAKFNLPVMCDECDEFGAGDYCDYE